MAALQFQGTYTALITPFNPDATQSVDWDALDRLIDRQVEGKVNGLVPCGTTGESPALSHEEHMEVVRRTVKRASGRVQVIAGAGSNCTREAIDLARDAERAGADSVMVVVPYYNKPSQEGLVSHFVAIAEAVRIPIVVYNIPGRTGIDLLPDTLGRICDKAPNVVAVKEATGNVLRAQEIVRRFSDRLAVLSGDDALTLPMIAVGAKGVISVTSNVLPSEVARATALALSGDRNAAWRAHAALLPVHESMFVESNPAPVKAALAASGMIQNVLRLPSIPASETTQKTVQAAIATLQRAAS